MSYNLDPLTAPAYSVKEGNGWLAVFNPDARRQMDVQLRSAYTHTGCVPYQQLYSLSSSPQPRPGLFAP